jgi:ADP-L-glycero-D-manno-heptose 6-epimerase
VTRGESTPPQWAGLKFFNVYGPNEQHKGSMMSVVAKTHARLAAGERALLFRSHHPEYADGGQSRDFVWVGDCVDVMLWLLDTPSVSGLFNCGSGKARSFADLTAAVFRALGKEPRIEFVDTPVEIRDKYQYFTEADLTKLRAAGYERPTTSLEDGITEYVRRYLHTEDPYR